MKTQATKKDPEDTKDITFDSQGKIIQIKRFNEGNLPTTMYNPNIKVAKPIVEGNYIKEALIKANRYKPIGSTSDNQSSKQ